MQFIYCKIQCHFFFITEISNWVKDETIKKMKEHENYTLLLDEATVGPNFLLLPLL